MFFKLKDRLLRTYHEFPFCCNVSDTTDRFTSGMRNFPSASAKLFINANVSRMILTIIIVKDFNLNNIY